MSPPDAPDPKIPMVLLSWHGTLVGLRGGAPVQEPLPLGPAAAPPFTQPLNREVLTGPIQLVHPELGELTLNPAAGGRAITLSRGGLFLCAERKSTAMAFNRPAASLWELFLPMPIEAFETLHALLRQRWIDRRSRRIIARRDIGLEQDFRLRIGEHRFDLTSSLPFTSGAQGGAIGLKLGGVETELVAAEPRSSALIATDRWPTRSRRVAELLALAAHRHIAGREPDQAEFEADIAALLRQPPGAGLEDLLERLRGQQDRAAARRTILQAPTEDMLHGWALAETAPWRLRPIPPAASEAAFQHLNVTAAWARLYRFEAGEVSQQDKPDAGGRPAHAGRAEQLLAFFRSVARRLPATFRATICVSLDDRINGVASHLPLFGFAKKRGEPGLLLPCLELLACNFTNDPDYADRLAYGDKRAAAIIAEGGLTEDHLQHRFIVIRDAVSLVRVLRSNSVPLVLQSDLVQFHTSGLVPWLHYVPLREEAEIERIPAIAAPFEWIAGQGQAFADAMLSRARAEIYTAFLLENYPMAS
jgi:hypothetical protein